MPEPTCRMEKQCLCGPVNGREVFRRICAIGNTAWYGSVHWCYYPFLTPGFADGSDWSDQASREIQFVRLVWAPFGANRSSIYLPN